MDPEITYFIGPSAYAVLKPVHFASPHHAENHAWLAFSDLRGESMHLFVFKDQELLLTIDRNSVYLLAGTKWLNLKSIHGRYSWEDIFARYVRCAVFKALKLLP